MECRAVLIASACTVYSRQSGRCHGIGSHRIRITAVIHHQHPDPVRAGRGEGTAPLRAPRLSQAPDSAVEVIAFHSTVRIDTGARIEVDRQWDGTAQLVLRDARDGRFARRAPDPDDDAL